MGRGMAAQPPAESWLRLRARPPPPPAGGPPQERPARSERKQRPTPQVRAAATEVRGEPAQPAGMRIEARGAGKCCLPAPRVPPIARPPEAVPPGHEPRAGPPG